jgi:hypothetical protein
MRMAILSLMVLAAAAAMAVAQNANIDEKGKSPLESQFQVGGKIRMELCASGTEIVGKDERAIRVSYTARGDDSAVRVRLQADGDRAILKVTNCPSNNFQISIDVPKATDLYVRIPAGQLDVRGVAGDKDFELHAGQINVDIGKSDDYRKVDASVYAGQVNAAAFQVSKGGLFRWFEHDGPGNYRLHAHVGAGQIDLR